MEQPCYSDGIYETGARSIYLKEKLSQVTESTRIELLSQVVALLAVNILSIEIGTCMGFIKIIIFRSKEEDMDIKISTYDLTWISSLFFLTIALGYISNCLVMKFLGRRQTLMLLTVPFLIQWIVIHYMTNATTLIVGLGLLGVFGGLAQGPIMAYAIEICRPVEREIFLGVSTLAINFGLFIDVIVNHWHGWKITALMNLGIPIAGFIALMFIPESPYWLASKGRLNESERALCWLRGWSNADHVRSEFRYICKVFARRGYPVGVDTCDIPIEDSRTANCLERIKPFTKITFWGPLILLSIIYLIQVSSGTVIVQTFTTYILDLIKIPMKSDLASTILGAIELTACATSLLIIHFIGKRTVTLVSLCMLTIFYVSLSLYCFFISSDTAAGNGSYIVFLFMAGISFFSQLGISMISNILSGEIFPMNIRDTGMSLANAIGYTLMFIGNKIFIHVIADIELGGVFLCFAAMNFIGCIFLLFTLFETKGKSSEDIAKIFTDGIFYNHESRKKPTEDKTIKKENNQK